MEYDFTETREKVLQSKQAVVDERVAEIRFLCRRWEAVIRGFYENLASGTGNMAEEGWGDKAYCRSALREDRRERLSEFFSSYNEKDPLTNKTRVPEEGSVEQFFVDEICAAAKCRPCKGLGNRVDEILFASESDIHTDDEGGGGVLPLRALEGPGAATYPIATDFSVTTSSLLDFVTDSDMRGMKDLRRQLRAAITEKDRAEKNIEEIENGDFEGAVCMSSSKEENFPVLVMLSCCHVFCFDCASKVINSGPVGVAQADDEQESVTRWKCPTCRKDIDEESTARIPAMLFAGKRRKMAVAKERQDLDH
ncbi:unnamed protein product [Amoebophrya sp. A120]|nr:unnamed protein product [Amoebophrya sp. A120]|eukprot:GSA120T00003246001.1